MAVDRSKQSLVIYKKDGTKVVTGDVGTKSANITGLVGGTSVAAGEYQSTYTDGTTESDKADVPAFTVKAAVVKVTGVTIDKTTNSIAVGASATAVAAIAPTGATDKAVTWASADTTIVTVDTTGKYTGVKAGTADVTVTTHDGSKTAKVTVTVTEA